MFNKNTRFIHNDKEYHYFVSKVNLEKHNTSDLVDSALILARGWYNHRKATGYKDFIYCIDYFNKIPSVVQEIVNQVKSTGYLDASVVNYKEKLFIKISW